MIPVTAISGCLIFAMFGATNEIGLVLFAIVYGFFSGGCVFYYHFLLALRN